MVDRRSLPRILTTVEADRLGLSRSAQRHAVRAHGWQQLTRGVLLTRDEAPTRDDWAAVGLALAGPDAALSGWDAACIRGVGGAQPPSPVVLVLDCGGTNRRVGNVLIRPTGRPFRATMLPAEHPTLAFARVVEAARAVADAALMYPSFDPVRAMVTGAIQRRRCTAAALAAELERSPRGGSRWLRRSLLDVMANAQSIAEAEAVDLLTAARLPAFEVNVPVLDRTGVQLAVLDILWRRLRAVAEIDSREFHLSEHDWKRTLTRHNDLTRHGLAVAHFTPSAVRSGRRGWAVGVRDWLRLRAAELGAEFEPGGGAIVHPGPPPPLQLPVIKRAKWPL